MSYFCDRIYDNHNIIIDDGIEFYLIDAGANNVEIVLPDCDNNDGLYFVILCENKDYQAKISCYGSQVIFNIGANIIFANVGEKYNFVSYSGKWYII